MLANIGLLLVFVLGASAQLVNSNITGNTKGQIVDLGYAQYQGYVDQNSELEYFLGLRFAAPPVRWQAPTKPAVNRSAVIQANTYGSQCFQSRNGREGATRDTTGSEDCLFLNVWRPSAVNSSSSLPVLVWIHGGGYGLLNGRADPTFLQQITNSEFVFVSIQYRLGAFGFLSSADVKRNGVVNAGLLDQNRALNWVQEHISSFGGNADDVTIFGESAGAGSVMLQLLSYGGSLGSTLFNRAILASPYLPNQYTYDDAVPTNYYYQFAEAAGCRPSSVNAPDVFSCLSLSDTYVLANASDLVSSQAYFGQWAFTPVTDGIFLQQTPSQQLLTGRLNGASVMVGNNALEGNIFTPQNITTSSGFESFVQGYLPRLSETFYNKLLSYYPEPSLSGGLYASQFERTAKFVSDAQFVCPGEWIADAYSTSYRYQYSVPDAYHGLDLPNYLPSVTLGQVYPSTLNSFARVFDGALVSFALTGTPNISRTVAFPMWGSPAYGQQVNFNVTDGLTIPFVYNSYPINLTISGTPNITLGDGVQKTNGLPRCEFWRAVAPLIPS